MANKRSGPNLKGKAKAKFEDNEVSSEEADPSQSQQSTSSGGEQNERLMEHIRAAFEKDRAKKEKKFLADSRKTLAAQTNCAEEVNKAVNEVERIYTKFLLDYAACEDAIQKTWACIQGKQEKLANEIEERRKVDDQALSPIFSSHFPGVSKMKASNKAFEATIERLASTRKKARKPYFDSDLHQDL